MQQQIYIILTAGVVALWLACGQASAFELRIEQTREAPTVPPKGYFWTDGQCWRNEGAMCDIR